MPNPGQKQGAICLLYSYKGQGYNLCPRCLCREPATSLKRTHEDSREPSCITHSGVTKETVWENAEVQSDVGTKEMMWKKGADDR
jgi:hypothetical protein